MKDKDVLIEIDGENIEQWTQDEVDDFLEGAVPGEAVKLLVADPDTYDRYFQSGEYITAANVTDPTASSSSSRQTTTEPSIQPPVSLPSTYCQIHQILLAPPARR